MSFCIVEVRVITGFVFVGILDYGTRRIFIDNNPIFGEMGHKSIGRNRRRRKIRMDDYWCEDRFLVDLRFRRRLPPLSSLDMTTSCVGFSLFIILRPGFRLRGVGSLVYFLFVL